jgi:hypothetical protein
MEPKLKKHQKSQYSDSSLLLNLSVILTVTLTVTLLLAGITSPCLAITEYLKGGAAYLKLGLGARSTGMGGCGVALQGDSTALHHNPAGLASVTGGEIHTMRDRLGADRTYNVITGALPTSWGTFALSLRSFSVDGIPLTELDTTNQKTVDFDGNPVYDLKTTGYFNDRQSTLSFSWGKEMYKGFSMGLSLKSYSHHMLEASGSGMGLDMGAHVNVSPSLSLGLAVRDISAIMKWNTESGQQDKLPATVVLGGSWNITDYLTALLDFSREQDRRTAVNFGLETRFADIVALRAGLENGNVTAGVGLKIADGSFIDAAYRDENLGAHYRISATVRFDNFKPGQKSDKTEQVRKSIVHAQTAKESASGKDNTQTNNMDGNMPDHKVRVIINGRTLNVENCIRESNGTVLAPSSFFTASATARVEGPDSNGLIVVRSASHSLKIKEGDCNVLVDDKEWKMLSAPVQKQTTEIYLPLSETLSLCGIDSSVSLDSGKLY